MRNRIYKYLIFASLIVFPHVILAQVNIASGLNTEVYRQFADDIANNTMVETQVYSTKGSMENLDLLLSDSIQLAFIQYDVLYNQGITNPQVKKLVKVFLPLYNEEIQLITLKNKGIDNINQLIGKRVGMGGINSGTRFTAQEIKRITKIDWTEISIPFEESIPALLTDSIDAFFFVGAAPSNLLTSLSTEIQNQLALVSITLDKNASCYIQRKILGNTYSWQKSDVQTYDVKSVIALNVNNVDIKMAELIDQLYLDLKYNLKGIQLNKFSHPKWKSVAFSDMENVDWPVFKEAYTMKERVLDSIGWLAALLSLFQIYFIINKLWKRKHEQIVTESISISAMFISILINSFFAVKNFSMDGYAQLSNNLLWILASSTSVVIGIGLFVNVNRGQSIFKLLIRALNLERHEAGDLAKAFFQPSAAEKIIDILGRLAMIDNELDKKEQSYIQKFADNWHLEIDWNEIEKYRDLSSDKYYRLRESLHDYLDSSPSKEQASHLIDVITLLIHADGKVSKEEAVIEAELTGIIKEYLGEGAKIDIFKVAVVPQNKTQESAILAHFRELEKVEIAGGTAYISEGYYSEDYAEEVSSLYRSFQVFSVVFKPGILKDNSDLLERIANQNEA